MSLESTHLFHSKYGQIWVTAKRTGTQGQRTNRITPDHARTPDPKLNPNPTLNHNPIWCDPVDPVSL